MGVSKVDYYGETLIDLTGDTVTPESVVEGVTFTDSAGEKKEGTFVPFSGDYNDLVNKPVSYASITDIDYLYNEKIDVIQGELNYITLDRVPTNLRRYVVVLRDESGFIIERLHTTCMSYAAGNKLCLVDSSFVEGYIDELEQINGTEWFVRFNQTIEKDVILQIYDGESYTVCQLADEFIPDGIVRRSYLADNYDTSEEVTEKINTFTASKAEANHKHAFNDLIDKPFGEEEVTEIVAEEQTPELYGGTSYSSGVLEVLTYPAESSGDETFVVTIDGTPYYCKSWVAYALDSYTVYIGDSRMWGSDSPVMYETHPENVPFLIEFWYNEEENEFGFASVEFMGTSVYFPDNTPRTIKIEKPTDETVVKQLDEKFIPDTIARKSDLENIEIPKVAKPDWNQNDETASDYVNNRTHWVEESIEIVIAEQTVEHQSDIDITDTGLDQGNEIIISVDGVDYHSAPWFNVDNEICYGDSRLSSGSAALHPEDVPFYCVLWMDGGGGIGTYADYFNFTFNDSLAHSVAIKKTNGDITYHTLDEKFIPDTIARVGHTHSYNDLPDKPFGEEEATEMVASEQTPELSSYGRGTSCFWGSLEIQTEPELNYDGETYIVTVDGVQYKCNTWINDQYDSNTLFLGDSRIWGNDSNVIYDTNPENVPFLIEFWYEEPSPEDWWASGGTGFPVSTLAGCKVFLLSDSPRTIKIEKPTGETVVVQLDEKFIPDTIARVGHTHSYNDLEDKPLGEYISTEIITNDYDEPIENLTIDMTYNQNMDIYWSELIDYSEFNSVGETIRVIFDGETYDCVVKNDYQINSDAYSYIGNRHIVDASAEDTGEPFFIFDFFDRFHSYCTSYDIRTNLTDQTHTISMYVIDAEVKLLDEKFIPETIARKDHTHSYNDLPDRPFGEEYESEEIAVEQTVTANAEIGFVQLDVDPSTELVIGNTYIVTIDGVKYTDVAYVGTTADCFIGNGKLFTEIEKNEKDMPFCINAYDGNDPSAWDYEPSWEWYIYFEDSNPHTVKVEMVSGETTVKQIDEKFIPDAIARKSDVATLATDAINAGLQAAKESGEFKGEKGDPGYTPQKGVDYFTKADVDEIVAAVLAALPTWTGGSY